MFIFFQYPEGIRKYDYIPNFATRGLHYDIQKVCKIGYILYLCTLLPYYKHTLIRVLSGSSDEDRCFPLHSARNSISVGIIVESFISSVV